MKNMARLTDRSLSRPIWLTFFQEGIPFSIITLSSGLKAGWHSHLVLVIAFFLFEKFALSILGFRVPFQSF